MRKTLERFISAPLHPVLFGIYFVFRLYFVNIYEVPPQIVLRPMLICMLACGILYLILFLISRHWHTAALMASVVIFMFFLYGVLWSTISEKTSIAPALAGAVWGLIILSGVVGIGWSGQRWVSNDLTAGVNLMAIILLLFPTIGVIRYSISDHQPFVPSIDHTVSFKAPPASPDIYYIMPEDYGRTDALKNIYGYDNSEFIQSLRGMGFYVAECSQSNYGSTTLSLASSLNMDYLKNLSAEEDLFYAFKLLKNNAVRKSLSGAGYKTVVFASGFYWAEWRDADVFISPPDGPVTEFETVALFSTYARLLDDLGIVNFDDLSGDRFRQRTRLVLKSFDNLVDIPGPKFVFVHVIAPHDPYAFDQNGNPVEPDQVDQKKGYAAQAAFIGKALLPGLRTLIKDSRIPPVIILQADEGPERENAADHLKILNAYYLPKGADQLYPSISPVNSFRIVFNSYFGTKFPLLEDISYYSSQVNNYDLTRIPNTCPK